MTHPFEAPKEKRPPTTRCKLCEIYIGPDFLEKKAAKVSGKYIWVVFNGIKHSPKRKKVNPDKEPVDLCSSCFKELPARQELIRKSFDIIAKREA